MPHTTKMFALPQNHYHPLLSFPNSVFYNYFPAKIDFSISMPKFTHEASFNTFGLKVENIYSF